MMESEDGRLGVKAGAAAVGGASFGAWRWAAAVAVLAFAVRAAFVLTLPANSVMFPDSLKYRAIAANLRAGNGFIEGDQRQASRAPGYPLLLAVIPGGAEGSLTAVRLTQAALGTAVALLVWRLGRFLFDDAVGLAAAALAAFYPAHVFLSGCVLSEVLFMALMAASLLLLARAADDEAPWRRAAGWALAAGVVCGLATLVRSSYLLFPLFALPFLLTAARHRRRTAGLWLLMAAGVAVALAPWVWRNYRIFDAFVPTTLQVGESLYEANSPWADGGPMLDRVDQVAEELSLTGERERDAAFRALAKQYMIEHPGRTIALAFVKLARFWNPAPNHPPFRRPLVMAALLVSYVPVMFLCLYGLARARRRWRRWLVLIAPVVYYSGLHTIFVGSIRYRTPVMIFLFIPAALGWRELRGRLFTRKPV